MCRRTLRARSAGLVIINAKGSPRVQSISWSALPRDCFASGAESIAKTWASATDVGHSTAGFPRFDLAYVSALHDAWNGLTGVGADFRISLSQLPHPPDRLDTEQAQGWAAPARAQASVPALPTGYTGGAGSLPAARCRACMYAANTVAKAL